MGRLARDRVCLGFVLVGLVGLTPFSAVAQVPAGAKPAPPPPGSLPAPPANPAAVAPAPAPVAPAAAPAAPAPAEAPTPPGPVPAAPAPEQPAGALPAAPPAPPAAAPATPVYPAAPGSSAPIWEQPRKPQLPEDFAAQVSPWFDLLVTSFWMNQRVGQFLNVGAQFGGYLGRRVRVSARVLLPMEEAEDAYDYYDDSPPAVGGQSRSFSNLDSKPASLLYGANIGIVAASTKSFVMSPGLAVVRTDVSDYGTVIGLAMPFEWTTPRAMRIGFEVDVGRSFGGRVTRQCFDYTSGSTTDCGLDSVDRVSGAAFFLQFQLGWGISSPKLRE